MAREADTKYYIAKNAFESPEGDVFSKVTTRTENSVMSYHILLFALLKDGTAKEMIELKGSDDEISDFIKSIQDLSDEISIKDFEKAEKEYYKRAKNLRIRWDASDIYHKCRGIDIVSKENHDVMNRVSNDLRKSTKTYGRSE
jgi:hypothetical protein